MAAALSGQAATIIAAPAATVPTAAANGGAITAIAVIGTTIGTTGANGAGVGVNGSVAARGGGGTGDGTSSAGVTPITGGAITTITEQRQAARIRLPTGARAESGFPEEAAFLLAGGPRPQRFHLLTERIESLSLLPLVPLGTAEREPVIASHRAISSPYLRANQPAVFT